LTKTDYSNGMGDGVTESADTESLPDEASDKNHVGLDRLRTNDRAETERFVREHMGWMLAVARRILGEAAQAEDAVQEAFAKIFKNLEKFGGRSALKTWMHRIVVNEALSTLRKRQRDITRDIDELMPLFDQNRCRIEDDWVTFETPQSLLERTQTKNLVSDCIARLPNDYRIVLTLRDIEELSTSDVADMLDISEANVKIRLHRARAALKKLLEPLMRGQEP